MPDAYNTLSYQYYRAPPVTEQGASIDLGHPTLTIREIRATKFTCNGRGSPTSFIIYSGTLEPGARSKRVRPSRLLSSVVGNKAETIKIMKTFIQITTLFFPRHDILHEMLQELRKWNSSKDFAFGKWLENFVTMHPHK
ncbi:unnamed protein product, partial [Brenthis ino]